MPVTSNHVVRNREPVTKTRSKALIASGLNRAVLTHGIEAVALAAGECTPRCIQKALAHENLLGVDKLINLLLLDPTSLSELLGAVGMKIVPNEIAISTDMVTVSEMSGAVATFCQALEDGRRNHRETLQLANLLRPLMPKLASIVHEADGLKAVA